MKALITAGGQGTRLRPLSIARNKHLLPIANKPMIFYVLDTIARGGITDVAVMINPGDKEVKNAVGNGETFGLNVAYIEISAPLGLPQILLNGADFVGNESFLFYLGDNLLQEGIQRFVNEFRERDELDCYLTLTQVDRPERYGVVEIKNGQVIHFEEKSQELQSGYTVAGIYIYNPRIFQSIRQIITKASNEITISTMHQHLLNNGFRIAYSKIEGWWKDIGTPKDLLEANQLMLQGISPFIDGQVDVHSTIVGTVIVEHGARVVTSTIRGPSLIGENCVIEKSTIGPYTVLGPNCHVRGSTIENSVIMENAVIETQIRILNSLAGKNVYIVGSSTLVQPAGVRFILGDQCRTDLPT